MLSTGEGGPRSTASTSSSRPLRLLFFFRWLRLRRLQRVSFSNFFHPSHGIPMAPPQNSPVYPRSRPRASTSSSTYPLPEDMFLPVTRSQSARGQHSRRQTAGLDIGPGGRRGNDNGDALELPPYQKSDLPKYDELPEPELETELRVPPAAVVRGAPPLQQETVVVDGFSSRAAARTSVP